MSTLAPLEIRIRSCGDTALTLECSGTISLEAFHTVQRLRLLLEHPPLPSVHEVIPAFTTLTLVYEPSEVPSHSTHISGKSPFDILSALILERIASFKGSRKKFLSLPKGLKGIPVCYDDEYAPDIHEVASLHALSVQELIRRHTEAEYRVAMLGFTPGFPYLLGLPPELATPRKTSPRARVEVGAVGIAGEQAGVYPHASPGGWNIIGRTPLKLFSPQLRDFEGDHPTYLRSGDPVKFYAISKAEFERISGSVSARKMQIPVGTASLSPAFTVLQSGFQTTIQDNGRKGWREYGVPLSGAADGIAFRLANALVGNVSDTAALEVLLGGLVLRFERDTLIALTGADVNAQCLREGLSERVRVNCPLLMSSGSILRLQTAKRGLRAYCAIAGGVDVTTMLGSKSTYLRAALGGCEGRALRKGDVLSCGEISPLAGRLTAHLQMQSKAENVPQLVPHRVLPSRQPRSPLPFSLSLPSGLQSQNPVKLRIVRGAEYESLTEESKQALTTIEFRVLPNSDRMGLRIGLPHEQVLKRNADSTIISHAVMPGTIQLPPSGEPIVLLSDAQTTGGYPVIGHVCSVDMPKVAQLRPDDSFVLQEITQNEAQKLYIEQEQYLKSLEKLIKTWLVCNSA